MTHVNAPRLFARRPAPTRGGWKPGAWTVTLVIVWLALLAVPLVGLYNRDALAPAAGELPPKPWMPLYSPIV